MPTPFLPVLLALLLAFALTGCHQEKTTEAAPEPKVTQDSLIMKTNSPQLASFPVTTAEPALSIQGHLNGRLVWDETVTVRVFSPFTGRVRKVLANIGEAVTNGAPLAEIESPDFGQAQADARRAESDLVLSEKNLARVQDLFAHGAAARKDVESAEADHARTMTELSRAKARLATYQANYDVVNQMFILPSPISGIIAEKNINPGQEVRPDQILANAPQFCLPLFVVTAPSNLWVVMDATEQDLPEMKPGQEITVHTRAYPNRAYKGKIDAVSDALDPATHTLRARASVPNPDRILKAEMFVTVDWTATGSAGLSVPAKAVFLKGDKQYVFIEEGPGKFERREIQTDAARDGKVTVFKGLKNGERVVSENILLMEQMMNSSGEGS